LAIDWVNFRSKRTHQVWALGCGLAFKVKSSRSVDAVRGVRQHMAAFGSHPLVADFTERTRTLLAA
jgi:hypothetical protein